MEFPGILEAYDAVYDWLNREGKQTTAPPREVNFTSWDEAGPDDPVCDIAFPYRI